MEYRIYNSRTGKYIVTYNFESFTRSIIDLIKIECVYYKVLFTILDKVINGENFFRISGCQLSFGNTNEYIEIDIREERQNDN